MGSEVFTKYHELARFYKGFQGFISYEFQDFREYHELARFYKGFACSGILISGAFQENLILQGFIRVFNDLFLMDSRIFGK